jgi:glycosyltransferase involved in cell wall biosynthesis
MRPVAPPRQPLSVVIIAKDEGSRLPRCVQALAPVADEVIVVDGGSTDDTVAVAAGLGCRVIENPWPGYGPQRNVGADAAAHDWILFVDADEVLDPALASSIGRWKGAGAPEAAFEVRRVGDFMGRWLESRAELLVRLYDRRRCRVTDAAVHEVVDTGTHAVGRLEGTLWHHGFRSLSDHVTRFDRYTTLEAQTAWERGERFSPLRLLLRPPARFLQQLIGKRLYREGVPGVAVVFLWVQYEVMRQLKLRELAWRESRSSTQRQSA